MLMSVTGAWAGDVQAQITGDGTPENPYILDNVTHLQEYAAIVNTKSNNACAKLTKDLDLSGVDLISIDNANFVGTIDGDGHSIWNLNNAKGLFKNIGAATIKNLTINNATLSATDAYSGAFASQASGTSFRNCTVVGDVTASSATTGGLVGNATNCTFADCHVSGLYVTGTTVGGLAGSACNGTTFTNCIVSGLTSNNAVTAGGIAGLATDNVSFTTCYSEGIFSVGSANAGALVGKAEGSTTFNQCYAATNMNNYAEIRPTFVSSTDAGSFENQRAQKLVDNEGVNTRWIARTFDRVNGVWNIVVTTGRATLLKSVKLWNADSQAYPNRRWKSMKVYGSASSDGGWTEMGSFQDLQLEVNNKELAGEIAISATEEYAYYRIDVLNNEGDLYMQMSDMKFVVDAHDAQDLPHLPICGSSDGSCTATSCYHYGSTPSAMSTPVEKADVASGCLAYLLNNGNAAGPYFQRIGIDVYPHLTKTGSNYVYLALDDVSYINVCPHRDCTIYPFKLPTCIGVQGNSEYAKCLDSTCGMYFPTSDRNVVTTNNKNFTLSCKAVNIQEHFFGRCGNWIYSLSKDKDDITYHNVMEVEVQQYPSMNGDYEISYTVMDDDPTMKLHLFFKSNLGSGSFSVRFYVNDAERPALRKDYPHSISEQHEIIDVDGLHRFDRLKVVFTYRYDSPNGANPANLFVGTEKPVPASHDLHKHELSYNCIDGGYQEYYECGICTNIFTQNTPDSDDDITTLSNLALAPVGAHNFGAHLADKQIEGNLYGVQCQNEYCTTFESDQYVLKNYNDGADVTLSYDGNSYTAKATVSLTDAKEYVTPVAFSAETLEYTRTFYINVWNAWFVPFNTTVEQLADNGVTDVACIESIHNYDMDDDGVVDKTVLEVILKKNGTVKAGVPYLVKAGEGYTYPMTFTDRVMNTSAIADTVHTETASAAYDFMGTLSGLTAEEVTAASIFSLNSEGTMVHRTGSILPQRWYMKEVGKDNVYEELSPAMSRAISIRLIGEEDEPTGIRTIYPEEEQKEERLPEGIFDLNGHELSAPQHGKINIINGIKQYVP